MTASVVVIGDAVLDVSARPATPIRPGADVPAEVRIGCGGQGANLAVRLARQGIGVELICGLGDDQAASLVTDALRAEGVLLRPVRVDATGTVVILVDEGAERTMVSQRAPFAAAAALVLPANGDWLVVSGYLLLEADAGKLAGAVAACQSRRILLGCAMPGDAAASDWLRVAGAMGPDLVILSRDEAGAIEPGRGSTTGRVITSPSGAIARVNGVAAEVRAPETGHAVDTTGAGDAFAAGLIASLSLAAWPPSASALEAALSTAVALGSAVAHVHGAQGRVAGEREATLRP